MYWENAKPNAFLAPKADIRNWPRLGGGWKSCQRRKIEIERAKEPRRRRRKRDANIGRESFLFALAFSSERKRLNAECTAILIAQSSNVARLRSQTPKRKTAQRP